MTREHFLVTGALGCIGAWTVRNLVREGVPVSAFDLGEHRRIVLLSVPEGDDKIAKYPAIFRGSHALAITKIDLLPHFDFSVDRVVADMRRLAPAARIFELSAKSGAGVAEIRDWLQAEIAYTASR